MHVNLITCTELLVPGSDIEALDALLKIYDVYNVLVCKAQGQRCGRHRAFQLAAGQAGEKALKGLQLRQRDFKTGLVAWQALELLLAYNASHGRNLYVFDQSRLLQVLP